MPSDLTLHALIWAACATALLHTLIPDHWLPFVLVGRARGWSAGTVAAVSAFSAVIHVALSLALGLAAVGVGLTVAQTAGHTLERSGAVLLVLFGLGYAAWSWRKGGHFHPGGALLHRGEPSSVCSGEEGPGHPEHLHYHADDGLIRGRPGWSGLALAVIVGVNPCVLVLPILLATSPRGLSSLGLVCLAYGLPTVLLVVTLSGLGLKGIERIPLPGVARHMELASGLMIAVLGVLYWVLEG